MSSRATEVTNQLRDKIQAGEYKPGSQLIETDLAIVFKASRNTVQRALLTLMGEGLVIIEKNKGAKVRAYSLTEILDYAQIREALEGLIISLAVEFIQEKQIEEMDEILALMKEDLRKRDLLEYSNKNKRFHQIIYDACPNRKAVEQVGIIKAQISKFNAKTILIPGRDEQSFQEHESILAAIRSKNAEAAREAIQTHIRHVAQKIAEYDRLIF